MAKTAQQQLVDRMVAAAAGTGGITVSSPSPGVLRVTGSRDFRTIESDPAHTYIGSGDPIVAVRRSASQYDFQVPHTVAPGDNWGLRLQTLTSTLSEPRVRLESTLQYIPGGFDHNTGTSTVSAVTASDRRLVVMEAAPGRGDSGKLFAIAPDQAGGIPFPTMKIVNALPVTGTTEGETTYVIPTRTAYVWSGTRWMEITPSPISMFPDDAAVKADTALSNGTYAVASNTGNMYVKTIHGWKRVGIIQVPSIANLPTDAIVGDEALTVDTGILYVRILKAGVLQWRPSTIYEDTEANIRAAAWAMNGTSAISTDTGRTFTHVNGAWIEEPIAHYATEAQLLATTPANGTLAWSDDTGYVFTRSANTWKRLNGPQVTVSTTEPAVKATGDMWYPTGGNSGLQLWDGTDANPANHLWRGISQTKTIFYESSAGGVYHIPTPVKDVVDWIELNYFLEVESASKESHFSCDFDGWSNISVVNGQWRNDVSSGSSTYTESATPSWVNGHNVNGNTLYFGYRGGGNSWYLRSGGFAMGTLTLRRMSSTKTMIREVHDYQRRDSEYQGTFRFFGMVNQPLSAITGLDYGAMGQEVRASHRLQYS